MLSFGALLMSRPCHCCWSALPDQRGSELGLKTDWEGQTVWLPFPGWAEDSARGNAVHAVPGKVAYTWEEEWGKNPIYACVHTQMHSHISEPNVLNSKCYANLQYVNTREHMDLIGSAVTKQHVHKHTCKCGMWQRPEFACPHPVSRPTRARLFRKD